MKIDIHSLHDFEAGVLSLGYSVDKVNNVYIDDIVNGMLIGYTMLYNDNTKIKDLENDVSQLEKDIESLEDNNGELDDEIETLKESIDNAVDKLKELGLTEIVSLLDY